MKWAYGVTTVPERLRTLLPKTLASLARAGFERPRLFVDGWNPLTADQADYRTWQGLDVTPRWPRTNAWTNWLLAVTELLHRDPTCDRFAVFQDDLACSRNLRAYLESNWIPGPGYANLYTFPRNQVACPYLLSGKQPTGWFEADQMGKGAVGLAFDRDTLVHLLAHRDVVLKCAAANQKIATSSVDGGVVNVLSQMHKGPPGWREWCHNPSPLQHAGAKSAVNAEHDDQPPAESFRGETYDLMELLNDPHLLQRRR